MRQNGLVTVLARRQRVGSTYRQRYIKLSIIPLLMARRGWASGKCDHNYHMENRLLSVQDLPRVFNALVHSLQYLVSRLYMYIRRQYKIQVLGHRTDGDV